MLSKWLRESLSQTLSRNSGLEKGSKLKAWSPKRTDTPLASTREVWGSAVSEPLSPILMKMKSKIYTKERPPPPPQMIMSDYSTPSVPSPSMTPLPDAAYSLGLHKQYWWEVLNTIQSPFKCNRINNNRDNARLFSCSFNPQAPMFIILCSIPFVSLFVLPTVSRLPVPLSLTSLGIFFSKNTFLKRNIFPSQYLFFPVTISCFL